MSTSSGARLSQLIWELQAPVLTLGARARIMDTLTLAANAAVAFSGDSYLEDFDWIPPFAQPGDGNDAWSDRSQHDETDLDRYVSLDLAVGRDFEINDAVTLNLNGGVKYSTVQWTAYGGNFIYSVDGFRDLVGTAPAGTRGATFQQRFPGVFLGAEATADSGRWTFAGLIRGGVTVNASNTDHHWARDLRFENDFGPVPFATLGGRVDYAVTQRSVVFLATDVENFFRTTGNTKVYDMRTGALLAAYDNEAAMDLFAFTLRGGLKLHF